MQDQFCPGAKLRNLAYPDTILCPHCKEDVEIWSDEKETICDNCNQKVVRE